jgi:predicted GIY-YIG superfamily endonuclease
MATAYRVYVLQNREDRFYIGLTEDLPRRIDQHDSGGSRWTKGKGLWAFRWQSELLPLSVARKLENRLKRQGCGSGFYSITGLKRKPGS